MSEHLTIMGEQSHYRARGELDPTETEKLLEGVEGKLRSRACTDTVSFDDSTQGSVANSEPNPTSILAASHPTQSNRSFASLIRNLNFYRWPDGAEAGGERVTPFAVVLLLVLLLIYMLNQADRLVLPVVIPNGLRCNVGKEDCTGLNTSNTSALGNDTSSGGEDCIQFNDDQQGLLTGKLQNLSSFTN